MAKFEQKRLEAFGKLECSSDSAKRSIVTNRFGEKLKFGPPESFAAMALSRHELPTLVALLNVFAPLPKDAVAWDVGGNAGFYAVLFDQFVGEGGKVFTFEPVLPVFEEMRKNLSMAGVQRTTPVNIALSNEDTVASISYDPLNNTTSSLQRASSGQTIQIQAARGDTLINNRQCEAPTVIKLDVEGHEIQALEGMRETLGLPNCRAVLCEVHFSILHATGCANPTATIKALLRETGFDQISFISRSHLIALKTK